jgi:hypothetical protein
MRQVDVARALGVSREAVRKWVKRGCPLDSLEEVKKWRAGSHTEAPPMTPPKTTTAGPGEGPENAFEAMLGRVRRAEELAHAALESASRPDAAGKSPSTQQVAIETRAYFEAAKFRMQAEKELSSLANAQALSFDDCRLILTRALTPLERYLEAFPDAAAPLVNPANPQFARAALIAQASEIRRLCREALTHALPKDAAAGASARPVRPVAIPATPAPTPPSPDA